MTEPRRPPLRFLIPTETPARRAFLAGMAGAAGVLAVAALAWSVVALIEVWLVAFGALLLAATLSPASSYFQRRWRLPRPWAATIAFLFALTLLAVALFGLIPTALSQAQELAGQLPGLTASWQSDLARLHARYPSVPEGTQVMSFLAQRGAAMLEGALTITTRLVWSIVLALTILFLAFFILLDGPRLRTALLRGVPHEVKRQIPALLHTLEARVGRYMLGLAGTSAVAGALTWAVMAIMGVPYALLIGAVTLALQAIPFVGPLVGALLAGALALAQSPQKALWVLGVYFAIQQAIGQFLFPLLVGRSIGMHPAWIALALLIGGTLYGLVGAFLAIPVAIALSLLLESYYLPWAEARADLPPEDEEP